MKIVIQGYWGAEVRSTKGSKKTTPEKYLKDNPEIHICDITIDGRYVGTIAWDGEKLFVREWSRKERKVSGKN